MAQRLGGGNCPKINVTIAKPQPSYQQMQEQRSICVSEDEVKTDEQRTSHMISGFDFAVNFAVIVGN